MSILFSQSQVLSQSYCFQCWLPYQKISSKIKISVDHTSRYNSLHELSGMTIKKMTRENLVTKLYSLAGFKYTKANCSPWGKYLFS